MERLAGYAALPCLESDGQTHSYGALLAETAVWRRRLDQYDLVPGCVVGLKADYSLAAVAVLLALLSRGCVAALIPRNCDSSAHLQGCCAFGMFEIGNDGRYAWTRCGAVLSHPLLDQLCGRGDAGIVIFTSGSTGRPKAALQSAERFLHKFQRPGRRFRTLGFLLFDHIAGVDTLFYALGSGGTLIVTRRRDPNTICKLIEDAQVEVLSASPSFLRLLCLTGKTSDHPLTSLKVITYGSEPMDPGTLGFLNTRFPEAQISQKYGTTETGSPRSESRGNDSLWLRFRSGGVETRVVDEVLWIRSEATILGYLNADAPIGEDGWYCTGDLVDVDGEWLRFRGRASDVINVGGEKVAPAEVERVILGLDIVRAAVVSGERHALMGQIVTARVVLQEGVDAKLAARAIRARCREQLAACKVPVKIDFVVGELTTDRHKSQRLQAQS
jgi:long-chain acyl-CoA synthetase